MKSKQNLKEMIEKRNAMAMELKNWMRILIMRN
jgi:hypothetical protein